MKKAVFLIMLLAFGCKTKHTPITAPLEVDWVKTPHDPYTIVQNEVKVTDLIGEWTLTDSKFVYSRGTINDLADFFGLGKDKQIMSFGRDDIKKIAFFLTPDFVNGVHNKFTDSTVTQFSWNTANGHSSTIVLINYTNDVLTLSYKSSLCIHNNYYYGNVYETYVKK